VGSSQGRCTCKVAEKEAVSVTSVW